MILVKATMHLPTDVRSLRRAAKPRPNVVNGRLTGMAMIPAEYSCIDLMSPCLAFQGVYRSQRNDGVHLHNLREDSIRVHKQEVRFGALLFMQALGGVVNDIRNETVYFY